ncbi:MAG: hypothetical protein RLZZ65_1 [Bacteroidota bacterium]|jgi:RNA polymerase sigma-70 factor (ECF subfamily)
MLIGKRKYLKGLSDADLLLIYKKKEWNACIDELYERYAHLLFGVFIKYVKDNDNAADLLMELFGKLPALLKKHEILQVKAWLHQVSRNEALQFLRKSKKFTGVSLEENNIGHLSGNLPEEEEKEEALSKEKELILLEKVMEQLKPAQKECIRLFFIEQLSYEEVMSKTQLSFKEVKSHLQNGKRNLKIMMEQNIAS